jgi:hypothetical protein
VERRLSRSVARLRSVGQIGCVALALIGSAGLAIHVNAAGAGKAPAAAPILQRFLALDDPDPAEFRALRHLEARNDHFDKTAWMDVWTEADDRGFHYRIVGEGGSEYIRSKVFRASLETERKMWAEGTPARASLTAVNYEFEERGVQPDGLASIGVKARRKDVLLVDGSIFLNPDDGELVRLEGRLVKSPSFWTRRVEIVRWYRRFVGIRMPVALESTASVLVAGKSTMRVTYEYETVNHQRVGTPQLRASNSTRPQ